MTPCGNLGFLSIRHSKILSVDERQLFVGSGCEVPYTPRMTVEGSSQLRARSASLRVARNKHYHFKRLADFLVKLIL